MCLATSQFTSLVDTIIDELVSKNDLFSAYDVTKEAKQRGATENHYQMKNSVHARWFDLQNNGYTRSLVPTPTGDTWVYHPVGADTQAWVDRLINGGSQPVTLPSPNTAPAVVPSIATSVAPSLSATATLTAPAAVGSTVKNQLRDGDNRLPIYFDQLSAIGAQPGDTVAVNVIKKTITVSVGGGITPIATYTVNNDGRIRIAASLMDQTYGPKPQSFKVSTDCNAKIITVEYAPHGS